MMEKKEQIEITRKTVLGAIGVVAFSIILSYSLVTALQNRLVKSLYPEMKGYCLNLYSLEREQARIDDERKRNADTNNDGNISIQELVDYYKGHDPLSLTGKGYLSLLEYRVDHNLPVEGKDVTNLIKGIKDKSHVSENTSDEDRRRLADINDDGTLSLEEALTIRYGSNPMPRDSVWLGPKKSP